MLEYDCMHFPFRLAGYENTLLGYRPRIYSTIKSLLKEDKDAIDVLMFGKQQNVHIYIVCSCSSYHPVYVPLCTIVTCSIMVTIMMRKSGLGVRFFFPHLLACLMSMLGYCLVSMIM